LAQAVKTTAQLADERMARSGSSWKPRWDAHIQIISERRLKISLPDVGTSQIIIASSSDGKDKAKGGDLGNSRENMGEVNTPLLGVAISDEAAFELVDTAIPIALDGEDHVAPQNISMRRKVLKAVELEGANVEKPAQFLVNGLTPVGRLRRGECLLISTRDDDVAHFQSGTNKKDATEARDIGLASVSSAEMRGAEMKQGMAALYTASAGEARVGLTYGWAAR